MLFQQKKKLLILLFSLVRTYLFCIDDETSFQLKLIMLDVLLSRDLTSTRAVCAEAFKERCLLSDLLYIGMGRAIIIKVL